MEDRLIYKELSYDIVGILFEVYNTLGYGYKEKYYEKAIEHQFVVKGVSYVNQAAYNVSMNGQIIARQYIDFIVDKKIVLEIKKGNNFSKQNMDQVKQYLQVTGMLLAILANFMPKGVKFIRVLNPNNLHD